MYYAAVFSQTHLGSVFSKDSPNQNRLEGFLSIISLFCINIALFMQKNFVLHIANLAIMAAIAIVTNLGFICMTLGRRLWQG